MKYLKVPSIIFFSLALIWACTSEQEPLPGTIDCSTTLNIAFSNQVDANCGQSDGSFTIDVTGGSGNYTFQLAGGSAQTSSLFQNLAAGTYSITVTDTDLGCNIQVNAEVRNQDGVNATSSVTPSDCNNPDGTIQIVATDGVTPYEYKLDDGSFQADPNFASLAPGEYTVTVRDASGCEVEVRSEIASTVLFAEIRTLVQANCATSGCHDGSQAPDFRVDANITGQAGRIRARTSARTMPPQGSGSLSDEQIANIICWVNDGAQGN
ncbi:c-type cytochrome [Roseivirga sp.]|uniref:c-type cytochrome n=1 Tax=Roseivirga sp. TaxID=1964215 RepID=UPI003B8C14A2